MKSARKMGTYCEYCEIQHPELKLKIVDSGDEDCWACEDCYNKRMADRELYGRSCIFIITGGKNRNKPCSKPVCSYNPDKIFCYYHRQLLKKYKLKNI